MIIDPISRTESSSALSFNAPAVAARTPSMASTTADKKTITSLDKADLAPKPSPPNEQHLSFRTTSFGQEATPIPKIEKEQTNADYEFKSRRESRLEYVKKAEPNPAADVSSKGATSPPLTTSTGGSFPESDAQKLHILVAATGSVATIKIPLIIGKLRKMYGSHAVVQLVVTTAAEHFLVGVKLPPDVKVWHDHDEWTSRRGVAEAVLHVQLRRWADVLLIAPMSANTLAKMANGICDNLITSVFRAWNTMTPVVVAPAMNTHMYTNPMTKKHLAMLKDSFPYVHVLKPIEKVLVCGDIGMGGMREWTDVVDHVVRHLGGPPMSVEEEEAEEERELMEKRAKRRRESIEKRAAQKAGLEAAKISEPHVAEEGEEDVDDDDDDDDDVDEGDEEDDEEEEDSNTHTIKEDGGLLKVAKPKLIRANTAEI